MKYKKSYFGFLVPFAWYLLITVIGPLVNNYQRCFNWKFLEHSMFVLIVPIIIGLIILKY